VGFKRAAKHGRPSKNPYALATKELGLTTRLNNTHSTRTSEPGPFPRDQGPSKKLPSLASALFFRHGFSYPKSLSSVEKSAGLDKGTTRQYRTELEKKRKKARNQTLSVPPSPRVQECWVDAVHHRGTNLQHPGGGPMHPN